MTKNDEDLKTKFEKEEGISQVSIIVTEDSGRMVLLDFEVDAEMAEADAKKVTEQFAEQLKEKYSEYQVDVQARKGGETFVQVTLD